MASIAFNTQVSSNQFLVEESSFCNQVFHAIQDSPGIVKTIEYAGMFFGTTMATLGTGAALILLGSSALTIAPLVAVAGGMVATASLVAFLALDFIVPPTHCMSEHLYEPASCEGGSLFYQGDVPVLTLDADNPYIAGKAHGYLLGDKLSSSVLKLDLLMTYILQQPKNETVLAALEQLAQRIPSEYVQEMQGLADGINKWSEEHCWPFYKNVTLEDVLLMHLMPDMLHYTPSGERPSILSACTAIVDRDMQEGITFARNMDWPSFGFLGGCSLIINRKHQNGAYSTAEVSVPGFVGTLTGMNQRGLSLAMNVCSGSTENVRGIPAAFFNRMCLERCANLGEVRNLIHNQAPLGPYHLTVADEAEAESFHFYQANPDSHDPVIRRLEPGNPLIVLNCRYPNQQTRINHQHHGNEREENLRRFYQLSQERIPLDQSQRGRLAEAALSLPFVNNEETTHRVLMQPRSKTLKVAFNNAYAGSENLHSVNTQPLFAG